MSECAAKSDIRIPFAVAIKRAVRMDIRACALSREAIALELTDRLGRAVTLAQIDAVASETHAHRFPAEWIPAWVEVTGSRRVVELVLAELGLAAAEARDLEWAEYGRLKMRQQEIEARLRGNA